MTLFARVIFGAVFLLGGVSHSDQEVPHQAIRPPAQGEGPVRRLQQGTVCVCRYDAQPANCVTGMNDQACRGVHRDCFWGVKDGIGRCANIHEFYCNLDLAKRQCDRPFVISSNDPVPACPEDLTPTNFFYTEHGHGPRFQSFKNNVKGILNGCKDATQCNFQFDDQTCGTFSRHAALTRGVAEARGSVNELQGLLKGRQTVRWTANQTTATATTIDPYQMRNPSWTFEFNGKQTIAERAVSCDAPMDCIYQNDSYLCKDANNNFRERVCCCDPRRARPAGGGGGGMGGGMDSLYDPRGDLYTDRTDPRSGGDCRWLNIDFPNNRDPIGVTQRAQTVCPKPMFLPRNPKDGGNWN